jgi:hypothetical protein
MLVSNSISLGNKSLTARVVIGARSLATLTAQSVSSGCIDREGGAIEVEVRALARGIGC